MTSEVMISVLVENQVGRSGLGIEHGLSLWIETPEHKVLFDAGQSDLVLANAQGLGIDLSQTDAIVLSHGHYDHTGGVAAVLELAPRAKVFLHPAALESRFSRKMSSSQSIGMSETVQQSLKHHDVIWTVAPAQVGAGIHVTGQVPRLHPLEDTGGDFYLDRQACLSDPILDDQSLWIETERGVSILLGCAHAGVMNILGYIAELAEVETFHTVLGGMHLLHASPERIIQTEAALHRYQLESLIPGHCTGEHVVERWSRVFPKCYSACFVGKEICL